MTGMRGLSGAQVFVVGDEAIKVSYDRPNKVVAQGEWLKKHSGIHLPRVHAILHTGYAMEKLEPIPTDEVSVAGMFISLANSVWRNAAEVPVYTPMTIIYVSQILERFAPHLLHAVVACVSKIEATESCMTHGDPTAENVMLRDGTYVVIDPIPATEKIPDDLAVDVGKILQSAQGWELLKGEQRATFVPSDVRALVSDEVFEMAERWCVVHYVRTLPYVSKEVRQRVLAKLEELLGV